jgi:urease accessory protein
MIQIDALPETFEPPPPGFEIICLPMTSADRARVRRKVIAGDGREIALALPTGTKLWPGQVLHCAADRVYVVEAQPEMVLVIQPRDLREAAAAGHLVGNMHRDIDLEGDGIAVLYDEVLEARLIRAGLSCELQERPFHGNADAGHSH